jgi:hydrogenase nickel incorporation protein HypA/HybF
MHELSISESILEIAVRHGKQAGASKVTKINIVIGRLSSIVDDSVQFYWDFISKDTICQGAQLSFIRIPARLLCLECGTEYTLNAELSACPKCESAQVKILTGEEFRMESIEIETEETVA